MASSSSPTLLPPTHSRLVLSFSSHPLHFSNKHCSAAVCRWGWRMESMDEALSLGPTPSRIRSRAFRILANSSVSSSKRGSNNDVVMVDPLEAKRLAAKQMEQIKAKEKLKKRRHIEAINGAFAMIGLTAGLVLEGQTGNGILAQLASYWNAIVHFFLR